MKMSLKDGMLQRSCSVCGPGRLMAESVSLDAGASVCRNHSLEMVGCGVKSQPVGGARQGETGCLGQTISDTGKEVLRSS